MLPMLSREIILSLIVLLFMRPADILLHELGHALAGIFYAKKKVVMWLGSDGNTEGCLHFNAGRLEVWMHPNIFTWRGGRCVLPDRTGITNGHNFMFIAGGIIASFLLILVLCFLGFAVHFPNTLHITILVALGYVTIMFLMNIIPRDKAYKMQDGKTTYNDGYQLKMLMVYIRQQHLHDEMIALYEAGDFPASIELATALVQEHRQQESVLRDAIKVLVDTRSWSMAKVAYEQLAQRFTLKGIDLKGMGNVALRLGDVDGSLRYYSHALDRDPLDHIALNNLGFVLNIGENFESAIHYLDRAVAAKPDYANAYNNRAWALMNTNAHPAAMKDISFVLQHDPGDGMAHRSLGLYHLQQGDKTKALEFFEKAKALDPSVLGIDRYIELAR